MKIKVGIVIVSYNTQDLTLAAIESIVSKKWKYDYEILIVDNASGDNTIQEINSKYPKIKVVKNNTNLGFAAANNTGLRQFKNKEYVLLLNSDTVVKEDSLDYLVNYSIKKDTGITSAHLLNIDGTFQPNGGDLPKPLAIFIWLSGLDDILGNPPSLTSFHQINKKYYKSNEIGWISGTAMLIRGDVVKKIGYLDEEIFMYSEDVDYCSRAAEKGIKVGWVNEALITHLGGASSKDPKLAQWIGEIKSLKYLYNKKYGLVGVIYFRIVASLFMTLRVLAFLLIGKRKEAKAYAKVLHEV